MNNNAIIGAIAVVVIGGLVWWMMSGSDESTKVEDKSWSGPYGQQLIDETINECMTEAKGDMGSEYALYEDIMKDYCVCIIDMLPNTYSTPAIAEQELSENNLETFFRSNEKKIMDDCLPPLMEAMQKLDY